MRRLFVLFVVTLAVTMGGYALAVAQDPEAPEEVNGGCPSPGASPEASPMASPAASPEASPDASPEPCPTPGAGTPAAGDEDGAITVTIANFAYDPDPVEVPVGGAVTWTNQDTAPHTATAEDRAVLQSGRLNQGQSFTQTFGTAGTYEYFCEFHANMNGTIVVE
jgi:plastocyanin